MMLVREERPERCASDLQLDRLSAGEMSADERSNLEAHLSSCSACCARHRTFAAEREAYLATRPQRPHPRWRRRTDPRRWRTVGAVLLAAVAASFLMLRFDREPGVRLKGRPHIGFFVTRNGSARRAEPGYRVRGGERVRFVYSSPQPAYLAIYGRDARGVVSVFYPPGERAQRVTAGTDVFLDSEVELDDVLGEESVYAVFCEQEFTVNNFEVQLASSGAPELYDGCLEDRLTWVKEPP